MAKPSALALANNPAYIALVWLATRLTFGGCAKTRRYWHCPLRTAFVVPTATTPSTYIFLMTMRTFWPMAFGKTSSPKSQSR